MAKGRMGKGVFLVPACEFQTVTLPMSTEQVHTMYMPKRSVVMTSKIEKHLTIIALSPCNNRIFHFKKKIYPINGSYNPKQPTKGDLVHFTRSTM